MGNTIFIKDRRVCVKLLQSRLEAIQKFKSPTTAKCCRSFVGMVNLCCRSFVGMANPQQLSNVVDVLWEW